MLAISEVALAAATKLIVTPSAIEFVAVTPLFQPEEADNQSWKLRVKPLLPPHMLVLNGDEGASRSADLELPAPLLSST